MLRAMNPSHTYSLIALKSLRSVVFCTIGGRTSQFLVHPLRIFFRLVQDASLVAKSRRLPTLFSWPLWVIWKDCNEVVIISKSQSSKILASDIQIIAFTSITIRARKDEYCSCQPSHGLSQLLETLASG
ncbi:hypothetical protein L1887_34468 [Cichorium endivia]|nr:hypothetical protein L1887_34468 [Cichorium endivia]